MLAKGIILGGAYRDSNILRRERSEENDFDQRSVPSSGSESFVRRNRVKRAQAEKRGSSRASTFPSVERSWSQLRDDFAEQSKRITALL